MARFGRGGPRIENLVEDGIDVAVRISELSDSSLHARRVGATRRVVVAAPSYLARRPPPRTPDELADHAVIQFTGLHPAPEWRFVVDGRPLAASLDLDRPRRDRDLAG